MLKDRVYVVFGHGRQPQRQRCCSRCTVCVSVLPIRNRGRIHVSSMYPTTMLVHMISFISVIAVMIYFVLIWIKSRSNLLIYSTGATSPTATPVSWTAWSMPPRCPTSTRVSAARGTSTRMLGNAVISKNFLRTHKIMVMHSNEGESVVYVP